MDATNPGSTAARLLCKSTAASPRFTRHRPGTRGRGVALLLAMISLLATGGSAGADEPVLPAGILPNRGLPPLLPQSLRDEAALAEALPRLIAHGRSHAGTRRGGDALFAAAFCYRRLLRRPRDANALYEEARSAYPTQEPLIGVVLVRHADLEASRGNWPAARRLLEQALPWRTQGRPANLEVEEARRYDQLADVLAREFPPLVARVLESEGSVEEGAAVLERMLRREGDGLPGAEQARLWERIATWRLRAGKKDAALAAINESIQRTMNESKRVDRMFWRLHASHGLIARDGAPYLASTWPGPAYEKDLRGFLRGIGSTPGSGTVYLALGSTAFAAGRTDIALEIYLTALRAPDLLEAARGDPALWRGLLMGYAAALELGRLDEADRILSAVERIADEPIEEADALRMALADARAARGEEPFGDPGHEEEGRAAPPPGDSLPPGTPAGIRPQEHGQAHRAGAPPSPEGAGATETEAGHPPLPWLLALSLGGVALWYGCRRRGAS